MTVKSIDSNFPAQITPKLFFHRSKFIGSYCERLLGRLASRSRAVNWPNRAFNGGIIPQHQETVFRSQDSA